MGQAFRQYESRAWGLLHTRCHHEKKVQAYFEHNGLPCYLPTLTKVRSKYRTAYFPMFTGYVFAAWGPEDQSVVSCCPSIVNRIRTEPGNDSDIIRQMETLYKIEQLSETCDIDWDSALSTQNTLSTKGKKKVTVKSGPLAGSSGFWKNVDGKKYFAMTLNLMDTAFEVIIDGTSLNVE